MTRDAIIFVSLVALSVAAWAIAEALVSAIQAIEVAR